MMNNIKLVLAALLMSISYAVMAADSPASCPDNVTMPNTYSIGSPIPSTRVAVMNLKVSGDYSEQIQEWLPVLLEDRLLKAGWTLVVRGERMQHVQDEHNLPGVKPETRLPDQEILGATAFIELNAQTNVKDIQGIIGYKIFQLGDYAKANVALNSQIVDPATGVLKASVKTDGSASGLKAAVTVTVGSDWRVGAIGYNIANIRRSLVGKAADQAAERLVAKLQAMYPQLPSQRPTGQLQPSSTTVAVESASSTILLDLPESTQAKAGDRYGIYRANQLIAEVDIIRLAGRRAVAKIINQTGPIQPTDTARKMLLLKGE